jgi:hypothetical protein
MMTSHIYKKQFREDNNAMKMKLKEIEKMKFPVSIKNSRINTELYDQLVLAFTEDDG